MTMVKFIAVIIIRSVFVLFFSPTKTSSLTSNAIKKLEYQIYDYKKNIVNLASPNKKSRQFRQDLHIKGWFE